MTCPSCGSTRVYPSRLRSGLERLRESITGRQPHRCHQCGRRWWADVEIPPRGDGSPTRPDDLRTGANAAPVKPTELDELDPIRTRT